MSFRWAFDVQSWQPTEAEIASALAAIQMEECKRIGRFMFQRDAKLALIGII